MIENRHSSIPTNSFELLVWGCKYACAQLAQRALEWLGTVSAATVASAINDEPGARDKYMRQRALSVRLLPPFVNRAVERTLYGSCNYKEVQKQFKREYSGLYPGPVITYVTSKKCLEPIHHELVEEIRLVLKSFTIRNVHQGERLLAAMRHTTLSDVIIGGMLEGRHTPGLPFLADKVMGPVGQQTAQAVLNLLVKATVLKDAQDHLGARLPEAAFMHILRTIDGPWTLFCSKLWKNMTSLSGHVRGAFPDMLPDELGSLLGTFLNSSAPIQDFENYLFSLSRKVRSRLESAQAARKERESVADVLSVDAAGVTSRQEVEGLLHAHSRHELSGSQLQEYGRALASLLRKSGVAEPKILQNLLEQGYHPETISREFRSQLRPHFPLTAAHQAQLPLADVPELPRMPEAFIKFYQDENDRSDVTTWLQQQSAEIQDLINGKLDLIAQGGRGKGLTRGRNDGTKGVCEWRVKAPNATLRIYYLPAQRDTGEITVLLIGTKANQTEDLAEATRRARSVIGRRGMDAGEADGDGASAVS